MGWGSTGVYVSPKNAVLFLLHGQGVVGVRWVPKAMLDPLEAEGVYGDEGSTKVRWGHLAMPRRVVRGALSL